MEITKAIESVLQRVGLTTKAGQESLASYQVEAQGVKLLLETFSAITRDMGSLAEAGRKILQTMKE